VKPSALAIARRPEACRAPLDLTTSRAPRSAYAAGCVDPLAREPRRIVRGQEHHRRGNLLGPAEAAALISSHATSQKPPDSQRRRIVIHVWTSGNRGRVLISR
jgi:hypothetical protein